MDFYDCNNNRRPSLLLLYFEGNNLRVYNDYKEDAYT